MIADMDLSVTGSPSLFMRDLSELLTLPYLGSFDVQSQETDSLRHAPPRVTYIALTKKVMPMLLEMFMKFKDDDAIYADETVEIVCSVRSKIDIWMSCTEILLGLRSPDEVEVRMSPSVQIWSGNPALEDSHYDLLADCQGSDEASEGRQGL